MLPANTISVPQCIHLGGNTVLSESRCALRLQYAAAPWLRGWLLVLKQPCDISPYSVVEQWLKCNTSEVFNCLIQFLLTMVLSIEEHIFLVEHDF
jgi:hypothetical protein